MSYIIGPFKRDKSGFLNYALATGVKDVGACLPYDPVKRGFE